jgi:hypothetical protein
VGMQQGISCRIINESIIIIMINCERVSQTHSPVGLAVGRVSSYTNRNNRHTRIEILRLFYNIFILFIIYFSSSDILYIYLFSPKNFFVILITL